MSLLWDQSPGALALQKMAGSEHEPMYHGTAHPYKPGDLVTTGFPSNYPGLGEHDKSDHVYATTDLDDAKDHAYNAEGEDWARRGFEWEHPKQPTPSTARVYRVEFTGPHEPDPETPETARRSKHPLRIVSPVWKMH